MEATPSADNPVESRPAPVDEREEYRFGRPPENLPPLEPPPPTRITDVSGVSIEVVDLADKAQRARFVDMPLPLYDGDKNFIAPLRMERMKFLDPAHSPVFRTIEAQPMLAYQGGKLVGRITAHIDREYNRQHETNAGWFGFFESVNDRKVAHALLLQATQWVKQRGATEIVGPLSFNMNHPAGLLVKNFDRPPVIETTYNPAYYEELITSFGFAKAKDLYSWWIDVRQGTDNPKVGRIARIAEKVKKREGVTIRGADMKDFEGEVGRIFALYNEAWEKNWGFVRFSKEELDAFVGDLKQIVIPELILFVELEGKTVGFSATVPDVNAVMPRNGRLFPFGWWKLLTGLKKIKHARLYTLGVIPAFRKRGLESLMFVETVVRAQKRGIVGGEIGWTLEDNDLINRAIESMDGKLDRVYRLLGMSL